MSILQKASRASTKIKMALAGASGSGKTYSALLIAYGITGDWSKIAVLDTENGSANLYANLGEYFVVDFKPPFDPRRYVDAIKKIEQEGIEVLIIDSISHEWEGKGGVLEIHSSMPGNSFTNWAKLTPLHKEFTDAILQSGMHIITTMRTKTEYVIEENEKGKQAPRKIGTKTITRDGMDYEFTIVLDIDQQTHTFTTSKDRTGLFDGKMAEKITVDTGKEIAQWCKA